MSVRQSMAINSVLSLTSMVVFIATSVVVNRILTPSEIGIFSLAVAIFGVLMSVQQMGLIQYIAREQDMSQDKYGTAWTLTFCQGCLLFSMLLALAHPLAHFFEQPELDKILQLLALCYLAWVLQAFYSAVLYRNQLFAQNGLCNLAQVCVGNGLGLLLVLRGHGPISLAWGMLAGAVTIGLLSYILARRLVRPTFSLKFWREQLSFGALSMVQTSIWAASARAVPILVGKVMGPAAVGYYSRAQSLGEMVDTQLLMPFLRNFLPSVAQANAQSRDSFHWSILRLNRIYLGLRTPAFIILAVLAGPALSLLFGSQWQPAALCLSFLALSGAVASGSGGVREAATVLDKRKLLVTFDLLRLVLLCVLILLLYPFGVAAIGAAKLIETVVATTAELFLLRNLTGLSLGKLCLQVWQCICLSVFAAAPAIGYMIWQDWPYGIPFLHLLGLGVSWIVLVLVGLKLTAHDLWAEIINAASAAKERFPALGRVF
jgi:O-antigen/teichoic acid export membrane protein